MLDGMLAAVALLVAAFVACFGFIPLVGSALAPRLVVSEDPKKKLPTFSSLFGVSLGVSLLGCIPVAIGVNMVADAPITAALLPAFHETVAPLVALFVELGIAILALQVGTTAVVLIRSGVPAPRAIAAAAVAGAVGVVVAYGAMHLVPVFIHS